jgi:hypothetical protein
VIPRALAFAIEEPGASRGNSSITAIRVCDRAEGLAMRKSAWWFAITIAISGISCAAAEDEGVQPFGPGPVSGASSPAPDPDDDGDEDEETGDDRGEGEGPLPPADSGDTSGGWPPGDGDDGLTMTDDGGPFPEPTAGGEDDGPGPGQTTPNCQSFCMTLDGCGFIEAPETIEDCFYYCAEPLDMGPCDAAWDVLAGCLGALDCNALVMWMESEQPTSCVAETNAEEQACVGV